MESIIAAARQRGALRISCTFASEKFYGVHPIDGNLNLYFDQMNAVGKHLQASNKEYREQAKSRGFDDSTIRSMEQLLSFEPKPPWHDYTETDGTYTNLQDIIRTIEAAKPTIESSKIPADQSAADPDLGKMFTKKQVQQRTDWNEWRLSCHKQLDQYDSQGMFSEPIALPTNSTASFMHWTFTYKFCGTKKSRMVCDGARNRSATTLGHTYANSLDAPSERLFWALVAQRSLIAVGADVSNAFAEADGPEQSLYMYIDDAYRDWWTNHLGRPSLPKECNVVRVHKAIQGHPESPRLWERHIDRILRDMGFQPTRHEPCLYSGTVAGEIVLFLRQVDDFAVAAKSVDTCAQIIAHINSKMSMDVKNLGIIDRFNGVDIFQTKHYVKLTCERYIKKMLQHHGWLIEGPLPINPIPLPAEGHFLKSLEDAILPPTSTERDTLRDEMGFNYRQVVGEILWPCVKCRPDISPHVIKLSQYLDNPGKPHYLAAREVAKYLAATITEGIYYWRETPIDSLPDAPLPTLHSDNHMMQTKSSNSHDLLGLVDSDWAADSAKRKSMGSSSCLLVAVLHTSLSSRI